MLNLRLVATLLAAVFLAACEDLPTIETSGQSITTRKVSDSVVLAGGDVVVKGPRGYCIDRQSSRLASDPAFVLLGNCASLSGDPESGIPGILGILTASVTKRGAASEFDGAALDQMRGFFERANGRALLARDGNPASVDVHDSVARNGVLFLRLNDQSDNVAPGLSSQYWRGLFVLNGRLVTISFFDFADNAHSTGASFDTLAAFLDSIRNATPKRAAAAQQVETTRASLQLFRRGG